jgi:glycosyltransferase involved in cell wall biosynthesis
MNVLLDPGLVAPGTLSGIGHHASNLAKHLASMTRCDTTDYRSLLSVPRVARRYAYIAAANLRVRSDRHEVVHYLSHYVPFARGIAKKVVTIYDLSVFKHPETTSPVWRRFNRHALRDALRRADAAVAISKAIRDEIAELFPETDPARLHVCPCGVREHFFRAQPAPDGVRQAGFEPYAYFLYVGDLTRRKNLPLLLKAFVRAKEEGALHRKTELVLVGKRAWGFADIEHLLRADLGIKLPGYLPDSALPGLYRYSRALVFPSLYEGFGIPLVEAMSQGAPIICSNIPTSRELDDRHGRQMNMFDPGDEGRLVELLALMDERREGVRPSLNYGDLGMYHYDAIARVHLDIFRTTLESRSSVDSTAEHGRYPGERGTA